MVQMTNKRNASEQATGYVLVRVEETAPQMIINGSEFDLDFSDSRLLTLLFL